MRYHATVHDEEQANKRVFECHVNALDTGAARVKVQNHLAGVGRRDESLMLIALVEVRDDLDTDLPFIG